MTAIPPSGNRPVAGIPRRKPIMVSQQSIVSEDLLAPDWDLPWRVEPSLPGVDLVQWATQNREHLERMLLQHGAILLRGFDVQTTRHFNAVIDALSSGALEYMFRASPRTRVGGNIYTSTDYPADQVIFPHNEHSYSPRFPLRLFFYCHLPSETGGETPIGSVRRVKSLIPQEIVDTFRRKKILYVRNYGDGFGLPWQSVFQTDDRGEVEAYCASVGIEVEWKDGNRLRTRQVGAALARHPRTGEEVWFNHGTFFHVSTLPAAIRDSLGAGFSAMDLPTNTFYGDGSPIEPDVLETLRAAYLGSLVKFHWQRGDVLLLDNMLAVHGREPYGGPRKIYTGMAEAIVGSDVQL
ncbi:TauD/TfdA family dioxygenase [Pseudomonas fulva]|uniref:TauD/TfdA family dioxygenase n=1 Tax=Pseudomonas fulva TaxID=47880 RepID=UPI00201D5574|nr:TauD/TfdA family dioxygenase [Pseudomonas fulva]UQY35021.1 TauD/TfdA family dioxygenase [Pseudomonas fulva]